METFPIYFANDHLPESPVTEPLTCSTLLIWEPLDWPAEGTVNKPSMYLELKWLSVTFSHFVINFIIINDPVPNEDRVLGLVLASQSGVWRRVG